MGGSIETGNGKGQDFDLNLAPIIDCFTVLITYLLVTASFLTLTALDVGVSATGEAKASPNDDPLPMFMTMEMKEGHEYSIKIAGGKLTQDVVVDVKATNEGWNYTEMLGRLQQIQKKWPVLTDVSLSAEPTVQYKEIVNTINEIKKVIPKVFISG